MNPNTELFTYRGTVVKQERTLPLPGEVLVEAGEEVQPSTVVARTEVIPGDPYVLDLAAELGMKDVDPELMDNAVLKKAGDRVHVDEPVARLSEGFLGETKVVKSPVDGVVEFVSFAYGRMLIREEAKSAQPMVVVNVARDLDVWPAMVRAYLRFREGQVVNQGEILAASPGTVGMDYSYAPASGTIERVDIHTGTVYITRPTRTTEVEAYVQGTVEEVIPDLGAIIVTPAVELAGIFGIGGEHHGELMVLADDPSEPLEADDVHPEAAGKVLVGGSRASLEAVERAVEVGARGVVVGSMRQHELVELREEELAAGITGSESLGLAVILTEGFGELDMAPPTFELLKRYHAQVASVSGRTQVRAGAVRPEVIIPITEAELQEVEERTVQPGVLYEGAVVRIVRGSLFGRWGTVASIPDRPQEFETGARLPAVEVQLDTGENVTVARANVESHG